MKRTMILAVAGMAVVLAWAVTCLGDTGYSISNDFRMDNRELGDTRICPPSSQALGPYLNTAGWNLLRGQLHCHRRKDIYTYIPGPWWEMSQTELAAKYAGAGFDFVAQTEHNELSPNWTSCGGIDYAPRSTELTPLPDWATLISIGGPWSLQVIGYIQLCGVPPCTFIGLNNTHVLSIGTQDGTGICDLFAGTSMFAGPPSNTRARIMDTHARQGLALVAHPNDRKLAAVPPYNFSLSPEDMRKLYEKGDSGVPDGIAIYNAGSDREEAAYWDNILTKGGGYAKAWGFAEEDWHPGKDWNPGTAWVSVPGVAADNWSAIKERLRTGQYYSYWVTGGDRRWGNWGDPPYLRVTTDNTGTHPIIYAQLQDAQGNPYSVNIIRFVGKNGQTLHQISGSVANYQCKGWEEYVRVRVWQGLGGGRTLNMCSQPIFINGQGLRTSASSGGVGILATSPELILRYLQPDEYPTAMPPAGYIGDVFDVSTAPDGQVPPGAVLDLSYEGEDLSAIGGTQYLAIYRYDGGTSAWAKVGGTVNIGEALITTPITQLGYYTISADLPEDAAPAEVLFDSPPYGGVVNQDTTVRVTVNDDLGAYQVRFYMNDHPLGDDADALDGWTCNLPYADYCEGDWTLKAVAEDLAGNRGEAEIPIYIHSATPPPTVIITSPASGSILSGATTITGTCGDDVAVSRVALYVDDVLVGYGELDEAGTGWTAQIDTGFLANGPRTLKAVVEDYPGNEASASIGVTINGGAATSIGSAKKMADGETVRVDGCIVTAGTPEMGGAFYIQAADRSAGIRVATDRTVNEGDMVNIAGVLATVNGERQVTASDVRIISSGNTLPKPLGVVNRSFQWGLKNTGLLVKTWGRITDCFGTIQPWPPVPGQSGGFCLDDGSDLPGLGLQVYGAAPDPWEGKYVTVTGISGVAMEGDSPIPVIWTRRAGDVVERIGE